MKNQNINTNQEYKYGFTTDIENIRAPKGLNEESIKFISIKLRVSIQVFLNVLINAKLYFMSIILN